MRSSTTTVRDFFTGISTTVAWWCFFLTGMFMLYFSWQKTAAPPMPLEAQKKHLLQFYWIQKFRSTRVWKKENLHLEWKGCKFPKGPANVQLENSLSTVPRQATPLTHDLALLGHTCLELWMDKFHQISGPCIILNQGRKVSRIVQTMLKLCCNTIGQPVWHPTESWKLFEKNILKCSPK